MARPTTIAGLLRALWKARKHRTANARPLLTRSRCVLLALAVAASAGIAVEIAFLTSPSKPTYVTRVDDVMAAPDRFVGHRLRIEGEVCGTIEHGPASSCIHHLALTTPQSSSALPVLLNTCVLPDTVSDEDFELHVQLEGELDTDGVFIADRILARCPSKYDVSARGKRLTCPTL